MREENQLAGDAQESQPNMCGDCIRSNAHILSKVNDRNVMDELHRIFAGIEAGKVIGEIWLTPGN